MTSPENIATIAGKLTKAQRGAILAARPLMSGGRLPYLPTYRDGGRLAGSLVEVGMALKTFNGVRLTPFGLAVHVHIQKENP